MLSCQNNGESFDQQQCSHESFTNMQAHTIKVEDTTEDGLSSNGQYIGFCVASSINIFKQNQCWIVNGVKIIITDVVKKAHPKGNNPIKDIIKYKLMRNSNARMSNFRMPKYSMVTFNKTQC